MTVAHVGNSTYVTGTSTALAATYTSTTGNTLVAYITAYNRGNNPGTVTNVTDTASNTWTLAPVGGGYDAAGAGFYGYAALAFCVNATAVTSVTAHFSTAVTNTSYLQVSEFSGIPAGSALVTSRTAAPETSYTTYTTPAVTVPAGTAALLLTVTANGILWNSMHPGTMLMGGQAAWDIITSSGSYSFTCTGNSQPVYGVAVAAIGPPAIATPATVAVAATVPVPAVNPPLFPVVIAEDASTPPVVAVTGASSSPLWTTAAFSPPAGSWLVALWGMGFSGNGTPSVTMSSTVTGNPAWTAGPSNGTSTGAWAYIYTLYLASAPGSITVTLNDATHTGTQGGLLAVRVVTGAAPSQAGAASHTATGTSAALNTTLTTTQAGSLAYVVTGQGGTSTTFTPTSSTTTLASGTLSDATDASAFAAGKQTSPTGTPGATSLGWTFQGSHIYGLAALEFLRALVPAPAAATAVFPAPTVVTQPDATVTPDTVTVTADLPAAAAYGNNATATPAAATVTITTQAPAVSPTLIFHIADCTLYSGTDYAPVVGYNNTAGSTLVACITIYNTGNLPSFLDGVYDDVANTWTVTNGGGSYDATTGLYGYTAIACCVNALAMNYITVYPDDSSAIAGATVQISEFAGIPAGSTLVGVANDSPDTSTGSYTAPAVTVPGGAYLILSTVASSSTWTSVTPGTAILNTQASWRVVTAAGSYAPTYAGPTQTVYGAVTVALGFATPMTTALFTPVGGWMGASNDSLAVSNHNIGGLLIVKVINTSDAAVYCTGLSGGAATWVPAGVPFFGTVNAMTATAFFGTVTATGAGTVTPTWSGATPASWTIAAHEFTATAGWSLAGQAGLDSAGTSNYPSLTGAAGGLYFGYATGRSATAGSTTGYTYNNNVDGAGGTAAYNPGTT